jgi:hypothetical protein
MGREFHQSADELLRMRYTRFIALQTAMVRMAKRDAAARKKPRR